MSTRETVTSRTEVDQIYLGDQRHQSAESIIVMCSAVCCVGTCRTGQGRGNRMENVYATTSPFMSSDALRESFHNTDPGELGVDNAATLVNMWNGVARGEIPGWEGDDDKCLFVLKTYEGADGVVQADW